MLPSRRPLLRYVPSVAGALLCFAVVGGAQVAEKEPAALRKDPPPLTANQKVLRLLEQPLETKGFEAPAGMSLKDFIGSVEEVLSKRGFNAPILIDFNAFKEEDPDTYKEQSDLYDVNVRIPVVPKERALGDVVRIAVSQIPTNNATFIVRNGIIEVTTLAKAAPSALMQAGVNAVFVQRPFASVVQQLADSTGVTIVVDQRTGKADTPVTATFNNGVPLKTALKLLADMAGHEVVEVPGAFYLTTVENARAFRAEQKARQREETWRKQNNIPEPNPPVQPKSDVGA
jgi:hypothetical protein